MTGVQTCALPICLERITESYDVPKDIGMVSTGKDNMYLGQFYLESIKELMTRDILPDRSYIS